MISIKGKAKRSALLGLPLLCLAAFALNLPLALPRWLLPARRIYSYGLGRSLDRALDEAGLGPYAGSTRIAVEAGPPAYAYMRARELYARTGSPVVFELARNAPPESSALAAWSLQHSPESASQALTLLFAPWVEAADRLEIRINGELSYSARGAGLLVGADRRLTLPLSSTTDDGFYRIDIALRRQGTDTTNSLRVSGGGLDKPAVLVLTERPELRSVVEALYPVDKASVAEALALDLQGYELIVLDGIKLAELGGALDTALAELARRGLVSILAVADSPDFGKEGDAPALERILPVDLSPRELKNLPDLAMLIMIDSSGSMFGDKLSLAKLGGIETLGRLKPGDLVGLLLFDEDSRWVYRFEPAEGLDASVELAPLAAGGGTRLYPALREGLAALNDTPMPIKHVVLISDGISEPGDFNYLAAWARERGISISAMAVGEAYDRALLNALSAGTGGRLYTVRSVDEIPSLILEDRMSRARTVFAAERVAIRSVSGLPAGFVDGMARFSAREGAVVAFASDAGDPLLSSRELAGRAVLAFSSDIYGRYSKDFFNDPLAIGSFSAILSPLLRKAAYAFTVSESADGLHVFLRGDALVAPALIVRDADGLLIERGFSRVARDYWSVTVALPKDRLYSVALRDSGAMAAKLTLYTNSAAGALSDEAYAQARAYTVPPFVLLRGPAPWLIAFFALSLAASVVLRFKR
ncbi:MAG TPA: hypothetical protein DCG47_05530 [Spirochaetaceae bacterium]|jgi:Mg-chelatase subunit ChlD|nr:hypothetical protein [Spirochaetaceae bacterium]